MEGRIVQIASDVVPVPPVRGGAIASYIYGISKALSEIGFEVHIITVGKIDEQQETDDLIFHRFTLESALPRISSPFLGLASWTKSNKNILADTFKIFRILQQIRKNYGVINVIHGHYFDTSVPPVLYKKLYHEKVELAYHYHNVPNPRIDKWTANNYDILCAVSDNVAQYLLKLAKINPAKVRIVQNAINVQTFRFNEYKRIEVRKKLGLDPKHKVVLYLGRIVPQKGLHLVIKALLLILKKIDNVKLVVAGPLGDFSSTESTQSYFAETMKLALKENKMDSIVYVGTVRSGAEASMYYSGSDLFVFSSLFNEACPTVILEAMASSLPIVAHDVGGAKELLTNYEASVLVPPGDVKQMAEAITYALTTYINDRNSYTCARVATDWSFSAVAKKLSEIYRRF